MLRAIIIVALFAVGCGRVAESEFTGRQSTTVHPDGTVHVEREAEGSTRAETPSDSAAPTTQAIDYTGTSNTVAGSHTPAAPDYAIAQLASLPLIGVALILGGGALYFFLPLWRSVGAFVMAVGGTLIVLPTVIDRYAWLLAIGIAVGVVWAFIEHRKAVAARSLVKLTNEKKPAEAVAALRGSDPVVNAAFKTSKK